ncbi:MAG: hypothetical protein ACP5T6_03655 [Candidatus Micrarchaeia archaeon]
MVVILIGYNLYKFLIDYKNIKQTKNSKNESTEKEVKFKDEIPIEDNKIINKDSIKENDLSPNKPAITLILNFLLISSLILILINLLLPVVSISILGSSFVVNLYQLYQFVINGLIGHSFSLQGIIGSSSNLGSIINTTTSSSIGTNSKSITIPPILFYFAMFLTFSFLFYIISVILLSLNRRSEKLMLTAGVTSILYSVFLIIGLDIISGSLLSGFTSSSSISLQILGFGVYFGIISGVMIITGYYMKRIYNI